MLIKGREDKDYPFEGIFCLISFSSVSCQEEGYFVLAGRTRILAQPASG
jgi:hypothetical protein